MTASKDKVKYLLSLLGRKRQPETVEEDTESFEDIIGSPQKQDIIDRIASPSSFTPAMPEIDDPYFSESTEAQAAAEMEILETYKDNDTLDFYLSSHLSYIERAMYKPMPPGYSSLDPLHPFMSYWLVNARNSLGEATLEGLQVSDLRDRLPINTSDVVIGTKSSHIDPQTTSLLRSKISSCIVDQGKGGISGGCNQTGHVASTYSAVLVLVSIGAFDILDVVKDNLYAWFMSLKKSDGSFQMHRNGESDARSTYCVLVVSSLLNLHTPELLENTMEWVKGTQTYEGGFAGVCGTEAHGGYTFCAFASYFLILKEKSDVVKHCRFDPLLRWTVHRQNQLEGALSGRTNKLVDACYSFWIGAVFPMLEATTGQKDLELFDRDALLNYILRVAQVKKGGFRDKPGKGVDFYHTNYTLCGLSLCEWLYHFEGTGLLAFQFTPTPNPAVKERHTEPIHPVYGIPVGIVKDCVKFFYTEHDKS